MAALTCGGVPAAFCHVYSTTSGHRTGWLMYLTCNISRRFHQYIRPVDQTGPPILSLFPTAHYFSRVYSSCLRPLPQSCSDSIASTSLHLIFTTSSVMRFMGKNMCNVRHTFNTMMLSGLLTTWTRYIATSPSALLTQPSAGSGWSRSSQPRIPEMSTCTQKRMRYQGDTSKVVHGSVPPSKR